MQRGHPVGLCKNSWIWISFTTIVWLLSSQPAEAQYVQVFLPEGSPGFDTEAGVTVLSRRRELYEAQATHIGGFTITPALEEWVGYDSNVEGLPNGPGSGVFDTSASLGVESDWGRNALSANVSVSDSRYFELPGEDHTDWTASLGGYYTLGRGGLSLGYAHLAEHELGTEFGALASTSPVAYTVEDYRASYDVNLARFTFTPNVEFQQFSFGKADTGGVVVDDTYRDRRLLQGGVTTRFDLGSDRGVLLELQGVQTVYPRRSANSDSISSDGFLGLTGIDYQASGVFRYRLLAGLETRSFASAAYGSTTTPIAEASVTWTPTGLTTITDTLAREVDSPASAGVADYVYTVNRLDVDHELQRNILLHGSFAYQVADYLGHGSQDAVTFGVSATWLISRLVRVSADYQFNTTSSPNVVPQSFGGLGQSLSGDYHQHVFTIRLRLTP